MLNIDTLIGNPSSKPLEVCVCTKLKTELLIVCEIQDDQRLLVLINR